MSLIKTPPDPDGHPTIPCEPDLDLGEDGFEMVELGIRNLVSVLWNLGFRTVCSCAGHTEALEPFPWVVIPMDLATSGIQLLKLAEAIARFNMSMGEDGGMPKSSQTWTLVPLMGPSGFAIYLQPFNSNTEHSPQTISLLRKSADQLAIYINEECGDIFS